MKTVMSTIAFVALTSSMMAAVSLPKECSQFVQSDSITQVENDVIQETNGIASICSLLDKELNILAEMEDDNSTKPLYLVKAKHILEDLAKFDIDVSDNLHTIDEKLKGLNYRLRSKKYISDEDKQTIFIKLQKNDNDTYNVVKYIYFDGHGKVEKTAYLKEDLVNSYPILSKKYGLIEEVEGNKIVVSDVPSESNHKYIVGSKRGLNIRVSPSKAYDPITQLEYRDEVTPSTYNNEMIIERGFVKIHFEDTCGWVAKSHIIKTKD